MTTNYRPSPLDGAVILARAIAHQNRVIRAARRIDTPQPSDPTSILAAQDIMRQALRACVGDQWPKTPGHVLNVVSSQVYTTVLACTARDYYQRMDATQRVRDSIRSDSA